MDSTDLSAKRHGCDVVWIMFTPCAAARNHLFPTRLSDLRSLDIQCISSFKRKVTKKLLYFFRVPVLKTLYGGHPRDPRYCPLNRGVRLVQVRFTENKGRKIGLY